MAATASFDELPAPLASTRQTVRCTVTKSSNESRLLAIKVTSQSDSQPEEKLADESFAPEPDPPVPQGHLLCHFDSTHWKHGETVTFRISAKTSENPDENVIEPDVRANMAGTGPINRFAVIPACQCGKNSGFLRAYLDEQKPVETNRFVFGFKTCPFQVHAYQLGRTFLTQPAKGRSASKALEYAYAVTYGDFTLTNFAKTIGWVGDPASRLRYLYDGTTSNTLAWKVAP